MKIPIYNELVKDVKRGYLSVGVATILAIFFTFTASLIAVLIVMLFIDVPLLLLIFIPVAALWYFFYNHFKDIKEFESNE